MAKHLFCNQMMVVRFYHGAPKGKKMKTEEYLIKAGVSRLYINKYLDLLNKYFIEYNFKDKDIQFFLANILHESLYLKYTKENLYYTAARLPQVWPSLFKSKYNPIEYEKNPEKLANLVYNSNIRVQSLGNFNPGDGFKYIGRGLMQTTGKNNYKQLSEMSNIDFVNNPQWLEQPEYAVKSAIIFFVANNLLNATSLLQVRKKVAGSDFGYKDVEKIYNKMVK